MEQINAGVVKAVKKDLDQIKNVIESSFMYDWAIKVEYAVRTTAGSVSWQEWGNPFYAITDSDEVLEKIRECCRNNPDCSMKLICQHYSPDCKFIYSFQH